MGCFLQNRGVHATGVILQNDGEKELRIIKAAQPAWEFFASDDWDKFVEEHFRPETRCVLVHTRHATVGDFLVNKNNHPMYHGKAAIIHNGTINNHEYLFRDLALGARSAETDSDIIRAIVDKFGITPAAVDAARKMNGGCASIALSPEQPTKMLILRSGNPLVFGYDEASQILGMASTKDFLYNATKPTASALGMYWQANRSPYYFNTAVDGTAYIFEDSKGMEFHGEFKSAYSSWTPATYDVHRNYADRSEAARKDAPTEVRVKGAPVLVDKDYTKIMCPKCITILDIPEKLKDVPPEKLKCKSCNSALG